MGDEIDPCECVWNHELAMRRLISLLRQGQSYCTDGECLDEVSGLPQAGSAGGSFLTLFFVMALAVAMYVMRPRRNQIQDAAKPSPANSQVTSSPNLLKSCSFMIRIHSNKPTIIVSELDKSPITLVD